MLSNGRRMRLALETQNFVIQCTLQLSGTVHCKQYRRRRTELGVNRERLQHGLKPHGCPNLRLNFSVICYGSKVMNG